MSITADVCSFTLTFYIKSLISLNWDRERFSNLGTELLLHPSSGAQILHFKAEYIRTKHAAALSIP